MHTLRLTRPAFVALLLVTAACGDDPIIVPTDAVERDISFRDTDEDAVVETDAGSDVPDTTATDTDDGEADTAGDAVVDAPDTTVDTGPNLCDRDNDGVESTACGGLDCNDDEPRDRPGVPERCDFADNNCNGDVNDGIPCVFFGHSGDALYEIDPFRGTANEVGEVPRLLDFDTAPDGTLYGITAEALFSYDERRQRWDEVGQLGVEDFGANGLAIDSTSTGFATASNTLYRINLETGAAIIVGDMGVIEGRVVTSSGDCVIDKGDVLYMTSKDPEDRDRADDLVIIDSRTGAATLIGQVGFGRVFGLTAAWGYLFGLTVEGELIEIDVNTGEGNLLMELGDIGWFGAASTPAR
ncbi:MAG: hypothetical protein ACI81R_001937 [Bradymonadia bacterium]|jgi:hypothetical protein